MSAGSIAAEFDNLTEGVEGWAAGITTDPDAEGRGGSADFGLSTGGSAWDLSDRYMALARRQGFESAAVARQVHGTFLASTLPAPAAGFWIAGEADGFLGRSVPGCMFCVTVADCAPVYVLGPQGSAFALLHAGWRGASAGILPLAIRRMGAEYDVAPSEVRVHLGPAICGSCYVVGPEVVEAFDLPPADFERVVGPVEPGVSGREVRFDLRAALASQAAAAGVEPSHVTMSAKCTLCDVSAALFSHRGGGVAAGRMIGWFGRRS